MPKILSVHPSFFAESGWKERTTSIFAIDQDWKTRSLLGRLLILTRNLSAFDVILINRDARLAALLLLVRFISRRRARVVFHEFYFDESRRADLPSRIAFLVYWLVARLSDSIVVHSSAEVELYARHFGVPPSQFVFLRYFAYDDARTWKSEGNETPRPYVLAPGRHRDFACFISSMSQLPVDAVIIAGETDRSQIEACPANNVEAHYELPFERYRDLLSGAAVIVLPLRNDTWQRSLGQVALLEAAMMKKPVIAADTFHLRDYAPEGSIARYPAGDSAALRQAIERVLSDDAYRNHIATNLHEYVLQTCTMQEYLDKLWDICLSTIPS